MSLRNRRRLTAWLGLFAMCLVVLVPLVSQWVVAARIDDPATAALCSVMQPAGDAAQTQGAHRGDPLAACGYCDLLADHPTVPAMPMPMLVLVVLVAITVVPALSTRFTPLGAFRSGRPRGPPPLPSFSL